MLTSRWTLLTVLLCIGGGLLGAGPDPVLPPEPTPVPTPERIVESPALSKYQDCFQRMIDAGSTDNGFMRRCLGLSPNTRARKAPSGAKTHLTKQDVEDLFDDHAKELQACYGKLLIQTKDLGVTPEGTVEAHIEVLESGKVTNVAFEGSTLSDAQLLACFRDAMRSWVYPKLEGETGKADVHILMRLKVRPVRQPSVNIAKGFPKLAGPGYGLTPSDVLGVFNKRAPKLRACYDALIKTAPDASGLAQFELLVSARGLVGRVTLKQYTVGDESFRACLLRELKTWKFPRPTTGEATIVRYPPFIFGKK